MSDNRLSDVIMSAIETLIDGKLGKLKFDRTYRSAIKDITPKGYVILDDSGSERTVKCCVPGIELKVGQNVWVKVPMGDLKGLHICGVV